MQLSQFLAERGIDTSTKSADGTFSIELVPLRSTPLLLNVKQRYPSFMSTILEVERLALDLPERERAALAANLLTSLPGVLSDEDEGAAEALRRDAEIDADGRNAISLAELDSQVQGRRG